MKKWIPLTATLLFVGWILSSLGGPKNPQDGPPVAEFGMIPVVKDGRHQPMDSVARNALLLLRKKQTLNTEPWKGDFDHPVIIPATQWMMELMLDPKTADGRPCFRIDNGDLKNLLHLPIEPDQKARVDGKHYSWNQIDAQMTALRAEVRRASMVKADLRNAYEQGIMDLWEATGVYKMLRLTFGFANSDLASYRKKLQEGELAVQERDAGRAYEGEPAEWYDTQKNSSLLVIPPHGQADWTRVMQETAATGETDTPHYSLVAYGQMVSTWRVKDWSSLSKIITGYREQLQADGLDQDLRKAQSEQRFNNMELFYKGMVVAVAALLCALLVWFNPVRFELARKTAVWLTALTLVILAGGVIWRMVHEGRPPVTNLYSSALFIGMAAVALGLVLEMVWPYSIGVAVSSMGAFGTLLLAHFLALDGDTMIMLRAVLDTNFWLATHVVIVTLGYASTFVAGFIGMFYVIRSVFTSYVTKAMQKAFASMVFAIICFASLFSFVGTVLGGIWADQSWGRFWGWDPKENGALIIVLWNVMVLHARLGGLVRERGLLILAIGGNIVTSWSWFGTNMLGIGLHSYGFMGAAYYGLISWCIFNVALIVLGWLPQRNWVSSSDPGTFSGSKDAPGPPLPPLPQPPVT